MGDQRIDWSQPIEHEGVTLTIEGWAKRLGLSVGSLKNRLRSRGKAWALGTKKLSPGAAGRRGSKSWRRLYASPVEKARA